MNQKKLIDYLLSIEKVNTQDIDILLSKFFFIKCKKKEILVSNNQVCDKVFFVLKGVLRLFSIDEKGVEKTKIISTENMFCTSWKSFRNQTKNNEFIQSIEDSEVLYIDYQNFYSVINQSPSLFRVYTKILEDSQIYYIKRSDFISNLSLQERLENFEKYFPNLQCRISNKVLASFLNSTPEHCSSTKKTLLKK